jgi:hypothetical protein
MRVLVCKTIDVIFWPPVNSDVLVDLTNIESPVFFDFFFWLCFFLGGGEGSGQNQR